MRGLVPGCKAVLVVALLVAGCSGSDDGGDRSDEAGGATTTSVAGPSTTTSTTSPGATAEQLCADAAPDPSSPEVAESDLTEVSGLAASRRSSGVLWMHNDSGGAPEVFAVGLDGASRGRYALEGAEATDWEDMALGPGAGAGTEGDVDELYLGDIGDNQSRRSDVTVYRVAEPVVAEGEASDAGDQSLNGVQALTLTYADGARDAETLLADPLTGDLFVVSKQWDGGPAGVYRIPAGTPDGASLTMERVADAALPSGELATGGDISADGSLIAVRTYQSVLLWDRAPDQTVGEALAGEPCEAPAPSELQGESVALLPEGEGDGEGDGEGGYVTVSEGRNPPIHRFALPR